MLDLEKVIGTCLVSSLGKQRCCICRTSAVFSPLCLPAFWDPLHFHAEASDSVWTDCEPSLPVAFSTCYVPPYSPSLLCFQEICWNFSWWPFPAFFFAVSLYHFNPFIVTLMTVSEDKYICWVLLLFSHCPVWLCNPMDYSQAPLSMGFPRQEFWSGSLFPSLEKPWEAQAKSKHELGAWNSLSCMVLHRASQVALVVKNLPANAGERCRFNAWVRKIPWRRANLSNILAWRIPRTEEPGGLQSIRLQRIGHNWNDLACTWYSVARLYLKL